ncbi:MAG: tRNA lysidine(34) synthetase TilS [bacterium]
MSQTDEFEKKVCANVRDHRMIPPGGAAVVAVSGGPDSVALLHALHALGAAKRWKLTAAHLNHGLRGKESDGDEEFVRRLARRLKIAFVSEKLEPGALERLSSGSLEEAARRARRDFLERARRRARAAAVALAHNRDDQVETVLFRLIRGASITGLAGMDFVSPPFIRPLLNVPREHVLAYCAARKLSFRLDSSNRDNRFLRNRIRNVLLPLLEREFNPNVRERIFQTSLLLRHDADFLDQTARDMSGTLPLDFDGERVALHRAALEKLPLPIALRVLNSAVLRAAPQNAPRHDSLHLLEILRLLAARDGEKRISLPGGASALLDYEKLEIGPTRPQAPPVREITLDDSTLRGGAVELGALSLRFSLAARPPADLSIKTPDVECFDYAKISPPLTVRSWRRGDFFHPQGMKGRKKLSDYFTDRKINRSARPSVPLLCDRDGILWIAGMRADRRCAVSGSTKTFLRVELVGPACLPRRGAGTAERSR